MKLRFLLIYPPNKEFFSKKDFVLFVLVSVCNFKSFLYTKSFFVFFVLNIEFYLMRWYFWLINFIFRFFTSIQIKPKSLFFKKTSFFFFIYFYSEYHVFIFFISHLVFSYNHASGEGEEVCRRVCKRVDKTFFFLSLKVLAQIFFHSFLHSSFWMLIACLPKSVLSSRSRNLTNSTRYSHTRDSKQRISIIHHNRL